MNKINSTLLRELFYILFLFIAINLNAQSKPGNTSLTVELWLKADQISQANGSNITNWIDQSGNNRNFSQNETNSVPTFVLNGMNFNPTLNFGETTNTKLVGPVNITNTLKEYYIYIVSYNRSRNWAMMLTFNQEPKNGYGWANTLTSPWQFTGANRVAANGANKLYNLSSAYVPNINNSSSYQYNNGIETIFGANTSLAFPTSTTNKMIIGASDLGTSYNFTGDISEIIVLSRNKVGSPDYTELSKINSYLALKYGITLPTNNQVNYFNSSEQIIWNRSNNIGFENHIFGLGRDDASSLNIKQAKSYSNDDIVLYLNSLQNLNKDNSGAIATNNSYLLIGSNNLTSTTFYKHGTGTTFSNSTTIQSPVYKRFNRIYKASNTNFSNNVNIKLNNELAKATHLLISNTTSFTPANTRIYSINNGIAENVNILNGEYISFVSAEKAPGGTDLTIELWLNSNTINSSDDSNITAWDDQSSFQRDFAQNNAEPVPTMNYSGMNFNPALTFKNISGTKLVGPTNIIDPTKEYYIFYVSELSNNNTTWNTILALNGSGYQGRFGWNQSKPWYYDTSDRNHSSYNGKKHSINASYIPNKTASIPSFNINGKTFNFTSVNTTLPTSATNLMVVGNGSTTDYTRFYGNLNEIIILSKNKESNSSIDLNQIKKINSYLAIKYGITLDTSEQDNYYNSDGNIIWNGTNNSEYQNAIFGIGRDDFSGLYQKQSTSKVTNAFTLFLGSLENINKNNNSEIVENKSFIILGSNNENGSEFYIQKPNVTDPKTVTFSNNEILNISEGVKRYNRILKVSKSGTIGPVNLRLANQFSYAPFVIVSNNTSFTPTNSRLYPVINGIANNIILNNGDYIGFINGKLLPGGTDLETELWLRADFLSGTDNENISKWYDISNYSRDVSQNGSNDTPLYLNNAFNYNPALRFGFKADGTKTNTTKLVGDSFANSNNAYYVFYVANNESTSTSAGTGNYHATFSFRGNNIDWSTGINNSHNWIRTDTDFYPNNSNYRTPNTTHYMVSTAYFTTSNTAVNKSSMFTNGHQVTYAGNNYNYAAGSNPKTVIGAQQLGSNYPFEGPISEMIVLSSSNSAALNLNQVQKINSYLALKHAITLDTIAHPNYYNTNDHNTNNHIVWDGSQNIGYRKDIISLGRDDLTGFYQKQSVSTSNNNISIYLGELANTNQENSEIINSNLSYLVLGSNGKDEIINYNNTGLNSERIAQRFARTLKVNKTVNGLTNTSNGINTVNFKLSNDLHYSSYIIVSPSKNFDTSTRLYPVSNGIAENVRLDHNDYVSFIPEDFTPAALTDFRREFWLIGDKINTSTLVDDETDDSNNFDVRYWNNLADNSNNFSNPATTPYYPIFNKSAMNYHSSVDFYVTDTIPDNNVVLTLNQNRARKLISDKIFINDPDRSYFIVYISRLNPEEKTNNTDKAVFSLQRRDNFGWTGSTNQHPWLRNNNSESSSATGFNENRIYGITVVMLPNTSTNRYLSLNGLKNNNISGDGRLDTNASYISKSVIGSDYYDASGIYKTENFFGEVMEVLVISKKGSGVSLNSNEIERLNTYYSIKYGVYLNTLGQRRYIIPTNTTDIEIYNSSAEGYTSFDKDIFGIVRNDKSGLYQKQAISTDNPIMTIFQGNPVETNYENTSNNLLDNEAVVLGATGDQRYLDPYSFDGGTVFANYTLALPIEDPETFQIKYERLSNIFNYKFRAKVTTNNETKSIKVNLAPNLGQWVLISKNANFLPTQQTRIYRITGNVINDVEINDGDYIAFGMYMDAPGGVREGLRMWLNASQEDTFTLNNNNEILTWTDFSGFGTTYRKRTQNNASATYLKSDTRTNFHPTAYFTKWQDYLITDRSPMFDVSPALSSVYAVVNHNFATDRSYFIGFGAQTVQTNARRPSFGVYRDGSQGRGRIGSTGLSNSTVKLFNPGATTIAGFTWNKGNNITFDFDANTQTVNHTSKSSVMNGPGMLGLASSSTSYYLQGTMPEVIAYEKDLSVEDRSKINSYLGLKYAITLRQNSYLANGTINSASKFNYVYSNNVSLWDGNTSTFSPYHNNVTSIIRDDVSKLLNRQSKSTDIGDNIHMGVGESLGVNAVLGRITENLSSLTFGNNGGSFTEVPFDSNSEICGALDSRISGRIWLASPNNFNQDVIVRAASEAGFPYGGPAWQVYLLIAYKPQDLSYTTNGSGQVNNASWDQIVPMYYVDGAHQVNYKFDPTKITYFTFAAKRTGACESCDFKGEKKLEFNKTTWPTRGEKTRTFNLSDNFNVSVAVEDPNNNLKAGYPRYSSRKSLKERRKGGNIVTTRIKFFDDDGKRSSAATYFDLLDIDRTGYTMADVQIKGYCNGAVVYPNLSYTYKKPERSRYTIGLDGQAKAKAVGTRYSGNSGYTNARGMAFVDFENPVDEIEIIFTTKTSRNSYSIQDIGIGSMSFYCVAPPPPPNEDGLIFTKQATPEALLCDIVDYTFRIINTNCAEKEFILEDELPSGMEWVEDSFIVSSSNVVIDPNSNVEPTEAYDRIEITTTNNNRKKMTVYGLKAPGGGKTYTMRASAVFSQDATAIDYDNQAKIIYKKNNNTETSLLSTDRLTGKTFSRTKGIASERPLRIETEFLVDDCYSLNKEIAVTLNINNPNNKTLNDMFLDFGFDEYGVSYKPNSVTYTGLTLPTVSVDEGSITLENFSIPTGKSSITLIFKTFNNINDYQLFNNNVVPEDITFSYDLSSESEDSCDASTTLFTNGEKDLSFCSYCTKPPTGGTFLNSDAGISTLQSKFSNWPTGVPNGFLVLEAGKKGMVITRTSPTKITNPAAGMIIYNTDSNCLSIYVESTQSWKCLERACNE